MRRVSATYRTARRQATWLVAGVVGGAALIVASGLARWAFGLGLGFIGLLLTWSTLRSGAAAGRRDLRDEQHWIATRPLEIEGLWELFAEPFGEEAPLPESAARIGLGAAIQVDLSFARELPVLADLFQKILEGGIHQVRDVRAVDGRVRLAMTLPVEAVDAELAPMIHRLVDGPLESIRASLALRKIAFRVARGAVI